MKTQLIVAAALLATAGFGCQRTYETQRPATADRRVQTEPVARAPTSDPFAAPVPMDEAPYGEGGQRADVNETQDMAGGTPEAGSEQAYGGSGMAGFDETQHTDDTAAAHEYGMAEESGMGGSGSGDWAAHEYGMAEESGIGGSGKAKADAGTMAMDHAKMGLGMADGGTVTKGDAGTSKLILK